MSKWKELLPEMLEQMLNTPPSKESAMILAAVLTIKEHLEGTLEKDICNFATALATAKHELKDADLYYQNGHKEVAVMELSHALNYITVAITEADTLAKQSEVLEIKEQYNILSTVINRRD